MCFNKKVNIVLNFLLVVEDELRKSQIAPAASPKQPVKSTKSNARENGPPELPPPRRDDKPPPLPPLNTIPSRRNVGGALTPEASPKDQRPSKSLTSERSAPPKVRPYQAERHKPDLPGKPPVLSDKKPQLPPGRPALPERFAKTPTGNVSPRGRSSSSTTSQDTVSRPQEPRKANTMKPPSSNKTPLIPNPNKVPLQPHGRPAPPGRPRQTRHPSVDKSSSNTSSESADTGMNTADPAQVIEEINRISSNLNDIASEGLPTFNRSLENFAQLSEQMLSLMQSHGKTVSVTMRVSQLRDKIGQFRSLMVQINSNPTCDYTSQLESAVSEISKKFGDLYCKVFQ